MCLLWPCFTGNLNHFMFMSLIFLGVVVVCCCFLFLLLLYFVDFLVVFLVIIFSIMYSLLSVTIST